MRNLKLLLVEDSPSDVRLIREVLKDTCIPVQMAVARDGVEAIEYLRQTDSGASPRPDVILLDLNMPRMTGREVLQHIKSSENWKQIPVLVMTSSRAEEDIRQSYALHANCFITKPSDLGEYERVVRSIEDFWFITATLPCNLPRPRLVPSLTPHKLAS